MTFQPLTDPVDYIILSGRRSPGIAEIIGAGSPRKWDERQGYAMGGAFLVFRGVGLAKFAVQLRLITAQDWDDWHAWRPLVQRPPRPEPADLSGAGFGLSRPKAMDIWHPILEDLEIRSVAVEDVLQPKQTADGEWTVEVKFIEYRRPKIALSRLDGSDNTPPQTENERVMATQEAEINRLRSEVTTESVLQATGGSTSLFGGLFE